MNIIDRRIKVNGDLLRKIAKTFDVSEVTVRSALRYDQEKGQTEKAKRIRMMALQNGGIPSICLPECETIHDANGMMRQRFNNGATIEVDKNTGDAKWFDKKGIKRGEEKNISVTRLYMMQEQAAAF